MRARGFVLAIVLASGLSAVPATSLAAPVRAASSERAAGLSTTAAPDLRTGDLGDDAVVHRLAPGRVAAPRNPTWPRGRITYYETIPAKWQWGLDRAIEAWNGAGAKVRFVKAASPRSAQVRISYGDTYGADGLGGSYSRGNRIFKGFVHLSPVYKSVDESDDEQRVWVGLLLTHELGHVLGFQHTSQTCSLMYPVYYFGECGPLSEGKPGYYQCRWIDPPLLRDLIRRYGGKAHRPPTDCPIYPLPAQLEDVQFSGGGADAGSGSPVQITWAAPARTAAGTKVRISVWPASSCGREPDSARVDLVGPSATRWTDDRAGKGPACYQVQVVNRSGAARPAYHRVLERYAPVPDAPVVTATWRRADESFALRWTPSPGVVLLAQAGDEPGSCPGAFADDRARELREESPGRSSFYPDAADTCVAFYASNGVRTSAAQVLHLVIPPPTATPVVGEIRYDGDQGGWVVEATLDSGDRLGIEVVAGACPAQAPTDAAFWDYSDLGDDRYFLWEEDTGPNCALVAAVDGYGGHGPVVMRPFTVDSA